MKALVIKTFYDKVKKVLRNEGDTIEVSKERYAEINAAAQFIKKVKKGD